MAYVITRLCRDCVDTACAAVCPEPDCIVLHRPPDGASTLPNQLFINPDACVDCGACEPECPWEAIFPEDDVPAAFAADIALNAITAARPTSSSKRRRIRIQSQAPTRSTRTSAAGRSLPHPTKRRQRSMRSPRPAKRRGLGRGVCALQTRAPRQLDARRRSTTPESRARPGPDRRRPGRRRRPNRRPAETPPATSTRSSAAGARGSEAPARRPGRRRAQARRWPAQSRPTGRASPNDSTA